MVLVTLSMRKKREKKNERKKREKNTCVFLFLMPEFDDGIVCTACRTMPIFEEEREGICVRIPKKHNKFNPIKHEKVFESRSISLNAFVVSIELL